MSTTVWTVAELGNGEHPATSITDALSIISAIEQRTGRTNAAQLRADGKPLSPLNIAAFAEYQAAVEVTA